MTSTEISSHQVASTKNTKPDTPSDARLNSAGKPWPGSEKCDTESSIKPRGIVARPGKAAHFDQVILQDPQRTKNWLLSPNTERYSAQHYQKNGEVDDMDFEEEIRKLQTDLNKFCCECHAPDPDWVSVNNGVFLCIQCAGTHRAYGVNISFVRSLTLDLIEGIQIRTLKSGGNRKFLEFVQLYKLHQDQ